MIHSKADVLSTNIGEGTRVWQFCVVLPGAVIGNSCNINCNVFIEDQVVIGNNVTIKPGAHIWDGVTLEDNVFIGPNSTFTNDLYPRSKGHSSPRQKTLIKNGASIGANSTILAGVTIGRFAMIGAGAVVTKNVSDFELWYGNPARHMGYVTLQGEVLDMKLCSRRNRKKFEWKDNSLVEKLF